MSNQSQIKYHWSKINLPLSILAIFLLFVSVLGLVISGDYLVYGTLFLIVLLVSLFFYSFGIEVDRNCLYIRYGVGIYEKSIVLADIQSTQIVSNRDYTLCMIYNSKADHALQINMRDGNVYVVPSNDIRKLQQALSVKGIR